MYTAYVQCSVRCRLHSSCDDVLGVTDGVVEEAALAEASNVKTKSGRGLRIRLFTPPVSAAPTAAAAAATPRSRLADDIATTSSAFVELSDILSPPSAADLPCYTTFGATGAGDIGDWLGAGSRPDGNPLAFTYGIGFLGEDAAMLKVCCRCQIVY